ncbi:MAG TPA: hypothetical protein VJT09_05285 [Pyrinomonadaceae bacterium]|nr:hypothetical protein [Pyrinomonadaceae bacterium]
MKRAILILIAAVVPALLLPAGSGARANLKLLTERLAARPLQQRRVTGRTLVSDSLPPIRISFGKEFKYVGTQSFILYNNAQVEQFFFVSASRGNRIRQMFMVQFEGYLPSNTNTYSYDLKDKVTLGGLDFMYDMAAFNVAAFRKSYPDSDTAHAASFLEGKGYYLEGEEVLFQRFVRLVDDARRNELLIIYSENLGGTGLTAADLSEKGRAASRRDKVFKDLSKRALKSFKVSQN